MSLYSGSRLYYHAHSSSEQEVCPCSVQTTDTLEARGWPFEFLLKIIGKKGLKKLTVPWYSSTKVQTLHSMYASSVLLEIS